MQKKWFNICILIALVSLVAACGGGGSPELASTAPTAIVTKVAGRGLSGSTDGVASTAAFYGPCGMATDGSSLYVADTDNCTIRKIDLGTGIVTTIAGSSGVAGDSDGIGSEARFDHPKGITTDGTYLYVADTQNYTIRRIKSSTGEVTTLAGVSHLYGSQNGVASAAHFAAPEGIITDGINLYVADTWNACVRKIVIATAEVTTLAGLPNAVGSADGLGSAATFLYPTSVATDGAYVYVADEGNNMIRKVAIATGEVTTLAGNAALKGSADGIGKGASFDMPNGIATYGNGLFVTDLGSGKIRKVDIATGAVVTVTATNQGIIPLFGITSGGQYLYSADANSIYKLQIQ